MNNDRDHIIGSKSETPPLCHDKKRLCIISVVVVIAVCIFLWFAGIFQSTFAEHLPEGLRGFVDEDPFDGEVYQWNDAYVSGSGLSLTIVDALEEKYHKYFEISVNDWNMGSPDVLNLRTSTTFPDSECNNPSAGTIKVCNGDYGDTGWKGQNSVLLRGNKIFASVSLMNDYYLDRSTPEDRLHIMVSFTGRVSLSLFHGPCFPCLICGPVVYLFYSHNIFHGRPPFLIILSAMSLGTASACRIPTSGSGISIKGIAWT